MKRGLLVLAAAFALAAAGYLLCPRPELEAAYPQSRAFFDSQGRLLRLTLADDDRYRLHCPLEQMEPRLIQATLLYEDKDFYRHPGVDALALVRAFWATYIARSRRVGASTIAMQVARLRWRLHTGSLPGKLHQILRALQLTRHYDKDRILEAYLNLAPYGGNIEGIQAASLIYFDKTADRLSLPEALTLAVVPQNPVHRNPATAAGFANLQAARSHLLDRWLSAHPGGSSLSGFFELPLSVRHPSRLPFQAPHFVNHLDAEPLPTKRRIIHTTLDLHRQQTVEALVRAHIARHASEGIHNAAVLVLDRRRMALKAMVGSANFFDDAIFGQVNGTTARRSPGSALKPFVYALAMDKGLIHPASLMKDAPRRYGGFTPENYDQRFLGPVSAHDALILSRNLPATRLQALLGEPGFHGFLQQAGIENLKPAEFYGLALCLGGVEVTMLELASLYAAMANGGELRPIRMLADGKDLAPSRRILSAEACFLTMDILKDNPPPESHRVAAMAAGTNQVAWKTGTSHGFRDAWAVGICDDLVVAVWVGNFDGQGNRAFVGRSAAGPLLFEILAALVPDRGWTVEEEVNFSQLNLRQVDVCALTGELPGKYCRRTKKSGFIPGVSPIRVCSVHRAIPVDVATGRRACRHVPEKTEMRVFEFWPSDLQSIFRTAGIALKDPPPFDEDCRLDQQAASGLPPAITSPQPGLVAAMNSESSNARQVPFLAVADGDVRRLYWFVDNRYVGASPPGQPLMWTARSGTFDVHVVDDHGRAASTALTVEWVR
ncbi:penicillin-binding protein 1C [uncultured Desulfosarcina sp.]|uniref:penicillin-binding protein 1C n=1 Tax=uncultured Desulfosarcina sp. TaxID=218289 RepID=UPI0029C6DA83|nr:penicillin-binding protein 1C [uncultured Desulfosarcina sp.]